MNGKECLIGMSGGVDSSAAAAILIDQGYNLTGITFRLFPRESEYTRLDEANCTSAAEVCRKLGISHITTNISSIFREVVISQFIKGYKEGNTPNPCIVCNEHIKFGIIMKEIDNMGMSLFSTGHYAKIDGTWLCKGSDSKKDQSYFLYRIYNSDPGRIIFPLGNYTKKDAKRVAAEKGLDIKRSESQDICFIPDNDYKSFLNQHIPCKPGEIIDKTGKVVGEHKGIYGYTIGQRKGLGALGYPAYVTEIDQTNNRIMVGTEDDLISDEFYVTDCVFRDSKLLETIKPSEISVKVRYTAHESPLKEISTKEEGVFFIKLISRIKGITPGQSAVFYHRDRVLGGGIITNYL